VSYIEFVPARDADHGWDVRALAGPADLQRAVRGGVAAIVLALLGGTTWLSGGLWAPDGAYTRFFAPGIGFLWVLVVSRVLLARSPATRAGW